MSKHEMIESIREHNRTASVPFLMGFSEADLAVYLRRLGLINQRGSMWSRESKDNAITVRDCLARRAVAA